MVSEKTQFVKADTTHPILSSSAFLQECICCNSDRPIALVNMFAFCLRVFDLYDMWSLLCMSSAKEPVLFAHMSS